MYTYIMYLCMYVCMRVCMYVVASLCNATCHMAGQSQRGVTRCSRGHASVTLHREIRVVEAAQPQHRHDT